MIKIKTEQYLRLKKDAALWIRSKHQVNNQLEKAQQQNQNMKSQMNRMAQKKIYLLSDLKTARETIKNQNEQIVTLQRNVDRLEFEMCDLLVIRNSVDSEKLSGTTVHDNSQRSEPSVPANDNETTFLLESMQHDKEMDEDYIPSDSNEN